MLESLADAVIVLRKSGQIHTITADYNSTGKLSHLLQECAVSILDTRYTENVEYDLLLTDANREAVLSAVTELTAGKAQITKGAQRAFAQLDGKTILLD